MNFKVLCSFPLPCGWISCGMRTCFVYVLTSLCSNLSALMCWQNFWGKHEFSIWLCDWGCMHIYMCVYVCMYMYVEIWLKVSNLARNSMFLVWRIIFCFDWIHAYFLLKFGFGGLYGMCIISFKILFVEDIWKVILKEKKVHNDKDYKNGLSSLFE